MTLPGENSIVLCQAALCATVQKQLRLETKYGDAPYIRVTGVRTVDAGEATETYVFDVTTDADPDAVAPNAKETAQ